MIAPLVFDEAARLVNLLDQTLLPAQEQWLQISTPAAMAEAIRMLRVRGAPAIGIAAAYGVVLSARLPLPDFRAAVHAAASLLESARPTAVNLPSAMRRMRRAAAQADSTQALLYEALLSEARAIEGEDRAAGRRLAIHGLGLFRSGMTLLTHCHTGGVATSGYGTALAPLLVARDEGMHLRAYVDETRPLLQGSRITAWELAKAGVDATLITDSMAAHVMKEGRVDAVIVGADRIAANGDTANKIGTYGLALLAKAHGLPFYVSAPLSTVDWDTPSGDGIVIEERASSEVTHGFGRSTAPAGVQVYNPAFDVTPGHLIKAIITEAGVVYPPFVASLAAARPKPAHGESMESIEDKPVHEVRPILGAAAPD